jgi:hypothetical protein
MLVIRRLTWKIERVFVKQHLHVVLAVLIVTLSTKTIADANLCQFLFACCNFFPFQDNAAQANPLLGRALLLYRQNSTTGDVGMNRFAFLVK